MDAAKPEPNDKDQDYSGVGEVEIIIDDSPGDTTIRPIRPEILEILRNWPRPQLPKRLPPDPEKA
jgi:hypothetical protein